MDDTRDYGTPKKDSATMVTLTIDGQKISVPQGTSIMRAASELGSSIPKLCATDSLEPFGSCRLCLVEIEGRRGYPASCTTTTPGRTDGRVPTRSRPRANIRSRGRSTGRAPGWGSMPSRCRVPSCPSRWAIATAATTPGTAAATGVTRGPRDPRRRRSSPARGRPADAS